MATTDINEFLVASKLKGKKLERISNIYDTYKINNKDIYIIILELLDSLPEEVMYFIDEFDHNGSEEDIDWLRNEISEIKKELIENGIENPTDYDWWMNMGMKNRKLAVFDVMDSTLKYDDYLHIDISDL